MLANWDKFVNDTVIRTYNDDRTYLYLCHMNGYKLKPCTKYCVSKPVNGVQQLELMPHGDYRYSVGVDYDKAVKYVVAKLSDGKSIDECFGLFN